MEPIFKYQYLIDKVINNRVSISHHPNSIYILNKNPQLIDWYLLSKNPNAIHLLEKNLDKVNWNILSTNPAAIHILEHNVDKICWYELSANPNAIKILEKNIDKIHWPKLSSNPNAINLLEANPDKIYWYFIVSNTNPNAINLIEKNLDKLEDIDWFTLSKNPNAIAIIEKNMDKISWISLSLNPNAIHILETNLDKVNWINITHNPNAVDIINNYLNYLKSLESLNDEETNNYYDIMSAVSINPKLINLIKQLMPGINYKYLAMNEKGLDVLQDYMIENDNFYNKVLPTSVRAPNWSILRELPCNSSLFDLDYIKMSKKRDKLIYYEIIEKALHPDRVGKFLDEHLKKGYKIEDFDMF
jgi:hypothetical protein